LHERSHQPQDGDLAGILVAVIAGHHQRRRPGALANHRHRNQQVGPAAKIVRIGNGEMALLGPGPVEIDRRMDLRGGHAWSDSLARSDSLRRARFYHTAGAAASNGGVAFNAAGHG
jgi:hypothetical protein